jgi:hypothetical protein
MLHIKVANAINDPIIGASFNELSPVAVVSSPSSLFVSAGGGSTKSNLRIPSDLKTPAGVRN